MGEFTGLSKADSGKRAMAGKWFINTEKQINLQSIHNLMANSVPVYLQEDKDYQEEVAWKVWGFFFNSFCATICSMDRSATT